MALNNTWQPQREPLQQLIQYLNDSLGGRDRNVQKNAELVPSRFSNAPDVQVLTIAALDAQASQTSA